MISTLGTIPCSGGQPQRTSLLASTFLHCQNKTLIFPTVVVLHADTSNTAWDGMSEYLCDSWESPQIVLGPEGQHLALTCVLHLWQHWRMAFLHFRMPCGYAFKTDDIPSLFFWIISIVCSTAGTDRYELIFNYSVAWWLAPGLLSLF